MPRRIALSGEFGADRIDALRHELASIQELTPPSAVTIDLGDLAGLSASCLAVLVCTLRAACAAGLCDPLADLIPPRARHLRAWLSDEKLRALLGVEGTTAAGALAAPSREGCVCESFGTRAQAEQAIHKLCACVAAQWELEPLMVWSMEAILSDLAYNVLRHADVNEGVMALSVDPATQMMEFAVVDHGIGVRASLAKNRDFEDINNDLAALGTALAPGRTSQPGAGKGMGLYFAKLLLAENGGTLTVRSGRALIDAPSHDADTGALQSFDGTLVTALASISRPLDLGVVIRAMERAGLLPAVRPPSDVRTS